jgi:hypothetical protein
MTTKHTPGTLRARHSYCGPDTDDPQMMRFACSIDCDAPFVNNIPESDHYVSDLKNKRWRAYTEERPRKCAPTPRASLSAGTATMR